MSVIFGLKIDDTLILAGDKRGSTKGGQLLTDELNKVIPINKALCIATAGNHAIEQAILSDLHKKENLDNLCVEDILDTIHEFYIRVAKTGAASIGMLPFSFIVAGTKRNGTPDLVAGQNKKGVVDYKSVPAILFHPSDCSAERCNTILASNLRFNRSIFVEQTVLDIARISEVVSTTGDKWIYNIEAKEGALSSF